MFYQDTIYFNNKIMSLLNDDNNNNIKQIQKYIIINKNINVILINIFIVLLILDIFILMYMINTFINEYNFIIKINCIFMAMMTTYVKIFSNYVYISKPMNIILQRNKMLTHEKIYLALFLFLNIGIFVNLILIVS